MAGICNSVGGGFFDMPPRCWCRWVSRLRWLMGNRWMSQLRVPAVLGCANCSPHAMVGGALSETVTTVSLSTLQFLDCPCCSGSPVLCEWNGHAGEGGPCCRLDWLAVRSLPDDAAFRWLSLLCGSEGSFQETAAPRKTAKNTVKHRDGSVGSVVANHRGGSESLVVVTTLNLKTCIVLTELFLKLIQLFNFKHD